MHLQHKTGYGANYCSIYGNLVLDGGSTDSLLHDGHIGESEKLQDMYEEFIHTVPGNMAGPRRSIKPINFLLLILVTSFNFLTDSI